MLKHHLTLHNDIEEIPLLADFVDEVCEEAGTDVSLAMSINLALEEAVTNSISTAIRRVRLDWWR